MAQENQQLLKSLLEAFNIPAKGTKIKENALQLLSDDSSVRASQSEVQARLNGLVEKSWILNNGALGEALQSRLEQIPKISNRWTPDVLSFLLALSDRPVHNNRFEDLASLISDPPTPPLTWDAIIEDDPFEDQTAVWRDIDFAADSSDEDGDIISQLSETSNDDNDSVELSKMEDVEADLESLIVTVDTRVLEEVSAAQAWRSGAPKSTDQRSADDKDALEILEINAIREVTFMLLGLPTSIFQEDNKGEIRLQRHLKLLQTSTESVSHLIDSFSKLGQKLSTLREWIRQDCHVPLEQAFQSALETRMQLLHSTLHDIQKRTLDKSHSVIVSIVDIYNEVLTSSRLLVQLHDILMRLNSVTQSQRPFKILESLYDQTCENQKVGDDEGYKNVARIFFQCFQMYLKPIQAWMVTGEADPHNTIMFVEKTMHDVAPEALWQDQYRLIRNGDGKLNSPQFLHVAGRKIFTAGKSVFFLKMLGVDDPTLERETNNGSLMSFEDVCSKTDPRNLIPFPELFDEAFAKWIARKQHSSSVLLRQQLESQCGLHRALKALDYIYLFSNGAISNNAVRPLFDKIERGNRRWNDSISNTELFREAFSTVDCIDVDRLCIRPNTSRHVSNIKERSMDILEKLQVFYALPWPIANIITSQSVTTYQRIFTFVTQFERARFLLQRNKLQLNASRLLYAIHTNLLWFANTLLSHLTTLVIAVNTTTMHQDMTDAEDVDAMITVHQTYITKLEDQCLLAKKDTSLHRAIISILDLTVLYSDFQPSPLSEAQQLNRSRSHSSSEDEEDDNSGLPQTGTPINHVESKSVERLASIHDAYRQLLAIVTASVESIRKADGSPIWTVLASNLAFGAVT